MKYRSAETLLVRDRTKRNRSVNRIEINEKSARVASVATRVVQSNLSILSSLASVATQLNDGEFYDGLQSLRGLSICGIGDN
jgi:hypothetical protein